MLRFVNIYFKKVYHFIHYLNTLLLFHFYGVKFSNFQVKGVPYLSVHKDGLLHIGDNFNFNNNLNGNIIGRPQRSIFIVGPNAKIIIGDNVGLSDTALISVNSITIGNNVRIGGNSCIYDTDFHSLDVIERTSKPENKENIINKAVIIEDNVFIGAHSTILKGVTIGKNSIIGACSVVAKNIPSNEIWAGNPAKFIKKID